MSALEIYALNVGQGDTTIIKTPAENLIVIDAYRPDKVVDALHTIKPGAREIAHLIVTHPHNDHYTAVSRLLKGYCVRKVTLAPYWYDLGELGPNYRAILNKLLATDQTGHGERTQLRFLAGYERSYPDGGTFENLGKAVCLELLGPANDTLEELAEAEGDKLTPNHLSIMARLTYGERRQSNGRKGFSMVFAADAQMENWAHYDREGMLAEKCDVLRAAHHGSKNGTQWERLYRLSPRLVIVSSETRGRHGLPDLIGSATFWEYSQKEGKVVLTGSTGTIKLIVDDPATGRFRALAYGEGPRDKIPFHAKCAIPSTDWSRVLGRWIRAQREEGARLANDAIPAGRKGPLRSQGELPR